MLYGLLTDSITLYEPNVIRDAVTSMVKYDPHDATRSQLQQLRKPLKHPSTPRIPASPYPCVLLLVLAVILGGFLPPSVPHTFAHSRAFVFFPMSLLNWFFPLPNPLSFRSGLYRKCGA